MIAHMAHVHAAAAHAGAAVVAAGRVHFHADHGDLAEKAVDRAEGADKAAEAAIAEHAGKADHQHDDELAREEDVQHGEVVCVGRIGQQEDCALKGARRTDVLAEAGHRHAVGNAVPRRNADGKDGEEDVLKIRQGAGNAVLFKLRGRDLMQQLLNKPQRAEPAADGAAQHEAVEHQDTEDVKADLLVCGADGVLQGAQRAGPDSARAGIAVEARHTDALGGRGLALVDLTLEKALDMGIV